MSKKEKQVAKPAPEPEPAYEDFFTSFLNKKKKQLNKKLEKIASMKGAQNLNKEQTDMINSVPEIEKKIAYYDEIIDQYLQAMSKQESESSPCLLPEERIKALIALNLVHGHLSQHTEFNDEMNKQYQLIFCTNNLDEALIAAKKFLQHKDLNNKLIAISQQYKNDPRHHSSSKDDQLKETKEKPAKDHHKDDKPAKDHHKEDKPAKDHHKEDKQAKTTENKFLQSDDEDHGKHQKHKDSKEFTLGNQEQKKGNANLIFLPEDDGNQNEGWLTSKKTGGDQGGNRRFRGRRGGPGYRNRGQDEHDRQNVENGVKRAEGEGEEHQAKDDGEHGKQRFRGKPRGRYARGGFRNEEGGPAPRVEYVKKND